MKQQQDMFEPFTDRLSRDIRNELSSGLVEALARRDLIPVREVAGRFLEQGIGPAYREYIDDRLARYRVALDEMERAGPDVVRQALLLWDLGLFFEVHELLEKEWMGAIGPDREFLQALIRAAGVYVKLEYGYREAAAKIAARALVVLEQYRNVLAGYIDPDRLLVALKTLDSSPPLLLH